MVTAGIAGERDRVPVVDSDAITGVSPRAGPGRVTMRRTGPRPVLTFASTATTPRHGHAVATLTGGAGTTLLYRRIMFPAMNKRLAGRSANRRIR
jgi:hypothetical protein